MQSVRRAAFVLTLVVAAAIAAEPLLHTHPLFHASRDLHSTIVSDSLLPCAICATEGARAIPETPSLAVPVTASWAFLIAPVAKLARHAQTHLPSRAPPSI